MIAYIVCEGTLDAKLLQRVLPEELLSDVEVVAAGGLSAAKSLVRSLLVRRQLPVAMVVDADSVASDLVQERLTSIEEIVKSVSVDTLVEVILAVPSIESVFFQDHFLLSRILGYEPASEILGLATFQPRQALQQLLTKSHKANSESQIINQLTNEDLEVLRQTPVIQEIIHFLQSVQATATVS